MIADFPELSGRATIIKKVDPNTNKTLEINCNHHLEYLLVEIGTLFVQCFIFTDAKIMKVISNACKEQTNITIANASKPESNVTSSSLTGARTIRQNVITKKTRVIIPVK